MGLPHSFPTRRSSDLDGWGREIGSVRISVTDKCNFRCTYCMPAEGLEWLRRDEILTFEEITRLVSILAAMGVGDVRLDRKSTRLNSSHRCTSYAVFRF